MEDESHNSETSAMLAKLKRGFESLPVWIIGHVAKSNLTNSNVDELSNRGAGSNDGDVNQTMFLVRDGEHRYLDLGKHRFVERWLRLQIVSYTAQTTALNEFGDPEIVVLRWGIAAPTEQSRKEAAAQTAELEKKKETNRLRQKVLDTVQVAWQSGTPKNRTGVRSAVGGNNKTLTETIENLLGECWLYEVTIPRAQLTNSKRNTFLVSLSATERDELKRNGNVPAEKLEIPPCWKKPNTACAGETADANAGEDVTKTNSVGSVGSRSFPSVPEPTEQGKKEGCVYTPSVRSSPISLRNGRKGGTNGIDVPAASTATPTQDQPTNPTEDF
jgi:hypothetical protein